MRRILLSIILICVLTEGRREVLIWLIPISLSAVGVLVYLAWKGGESRG